MEISHWVSEIEVSCHESNVRQLHAVVAEVVDRRVCPGVIVYIQEREIGMMEM